MELALGVGSLVLVAGGTAALIRRAMRPGQAVSVLGIAVLVAVIALLAESLARGRGLGSFYVVLVVATMTLAGMLAAVVVIVQPRR
jgi:hypothetical protein